MHPAENPQGEGARKILWALALLGIAIVLIGATLLFWRGTLMGGMKPPAPYPREDPREQVRFESGLIVHELQQSQSHELQSYSWVSAQGKSGAARFAKVPIERAMSLYVQNYGTEGERSR